MYIACLLYKLKLINYIARPNTLTITYIVLLSYLYVALPFNINYIFVKYIISCV